MNNFFTIGIKLDCLYTLFIIDRTIENKLKNHIRIHQIIH